MRTLGFALLLLPTVALAQPPSYGSVPTPKPRTEVIVISPPPLEPRPGQMLILRSRPDGTTRVTVCSWLQGVGLLCTVGR